MVGTRSWRRSALGAVAAIAMAVGVAGPVAAADDPAFVVDFPAGIACPFDLRIAGYGDGQEVYREFGDGAVLTAGTGYALTYANLGTNEMISTKANGSVTWTTTRADGSTRMTLTGNNVVILFPSDGGPSTTVYSGRVIIDVGTDGVWTVRKVAATALDVCAALS